MKTDIIVIGAGAAGLMAAIGAAERLAKDGCADQVTVLEKMPRPGRKIMITGKGRCNFTNVKTWNDFQGHIRSKANAVKAAFYNLSPEALMEFFEREGMPVVVERGDRAFPESHHSSDVVDALVRAAQGFGAKIEVECEISSVAKDDSGFTVTTTDGRTWQSKELIIATGGFSYPTTGSTGDGFRWAAETGHKVTTTFPSLTALVPKGYKDTSDNAPEMKGHINRNSPLTDLGSSLNGLQLKNVGLSTIIDGQKVEDEFGDLDFTDGGIEGPIGFQVSRRCVKSIMNGSKVQLVLDLKPGVDPEELYTRIKDLWQEISKDPRSQNISVKEQYRILLGKLMPWDLIPGFRSTHEDLVEVKHTTSGKKATSHGISYQFSTNTRINLKGLAEALQHWVFDIEGFVGYERCVITAGGVSIDDIVPKTMESRIVPGLYFCGEVLDMDCDTGGYNLQAAFCTGYLAGQSAAKALL